MLFKLETRLRRLVWRASNPVYGVFISSTVLSFFAMKALASSYGPADTHRRRVEADGTYAKRRFAEVNDSERQAAEAAGAAAQLRLRGVDELAPYSSARPPAFLPPPSLPPSLPLALTAPRRAALFPAPLSPQTRSTGSRRTPSAATARTA
jgi:hypothetical protein